MCCASTCRSWRPAGRDSGRGPDHPPTALDLTSGRLLCAARRTVPVVRLAEQKGAGRRCQRQRLSTGQPSLCGLSPANMLTWQGSTTTTCTTCGTRRTIWRRVEPQISFYEFCAEGQAQQADADAIIAHKQADLTKNQVAEDALKLQRSIRQLEAARDVAKLDWQVSQGELDAVGPGCRPGSHLRETSRMLNSRANDKYAAYLEPNSSLPRLSFSFCALPVSWRIGPFPPLKSHFAEYR